MKITDLHMHVVPGVDDGSVNIDQTIKMMQVAYDDGTRGMIATPHYHIGRMVSDRKECESKLEAVKKKAKEAKRAFREAEKAKKEAEKNMSDADRLRHKMAELANK